MSSRTTPKFIWVTKLAVLGGNLVAIVQPGMGYVHTSAAGRIQSQVGFNDFNFGGAIKWDWKTFHHLSGVKIIGAEVEVQDMKWI